MRLRGALGFVMGIIASLWLLTLRVRLSVDPALADASRPWLLSFFHGTQFPLLAWKHRRRTVVMVSHSEDGAIQASALRVRGFQVVRGSSSRGGARALATVVRAMRTGRMDAAFAVDGPRGPYGKAKEGALVAARASGGVMVPMGSACRRALVFERAWDKFVLPLPFSRVAVTLGAPLEPTSPEALERAIQDANHHAARSLSSLHVVAEREDDRAPEGA